MRHPQRGADQKQTDVSMRRTQGPNRRNCMAGGAVKARSATGLQDHLPAYDRCFNAVLDATLEMRALPSSQFGCDEVDGLLGSITAVRSKTAVRVRSFAS